MVFVIIGGCFGYHQWKKSVKIKRAEYLNELTEKIRTDDDISEMLSEMYRSLVNGGEL